MKIERVIINTDGASRGNPGPAAIGATIKDERGRLITTISRSIGETTSNQVEYQAIIAALQKAVELGARQVEICADSELMVKQLNGRYRVRKASLRPSYQQVGQLLSQFDSFTIIHVPREQNKEADELANTALW